MKKLLPILFLSLGLIGNSYAEICDEESSIQKRNGIVFLPNKTKPFSGENLCIYDNGQYKVKGEFTEGLKDGKWTNWGKNGIKKTEETFRLGDIQAKTIFSSEHYQKLEKIIYTDDREISKTKWRYYPNKQLSEEFQYKNGKLHGLGRNWYENGQKMALLTFVNGLKNGSITLWYENGQISEMGNYINNNLNGIKTKWSENGQLVGKYKYVNSELIFSTVYIYYPNGQLKQMYGKQEDDSDEWKYVAKLDGNWTHWYENGQKKQEQHYDDGVLNGSIKSWHENGQLECEGNNKNGNNHGKMMCWHDNGLLSAEVSFKDGKNEGKMSFFYPSGALKMEGDYINNSAVVTMWHENGIKSGTIPVKDNLANGIVIEWYENGSKRRSGNVVDNYPDGKQTHFYSQNNQKKLVYNCLNGAPIGEVLGWKSNGQAYNAGGFRDGRGKFLALHDNGNKEVEIYLRGGIQVTTTYWDENNFKTLEYIYENPDSGYGITKNIYWKGAIRKTSFSYGKQDLGLCSGYEPFEQGALSL